MRKIYSIFIFALCILFAGCSEDDNNESSGVRLKVISSEVSFTCTGGNGMIKVNSDLKISAASTGEWCQVTVENKTVNVVVAPNLKINSRTAMVTIKAGEEVTQVPVYQQGDIFDTDMRSTIFASKEQEITFHMKSNWDVQFEGIDETWVSYTLANDQVTFKIAALAEGGKYRKNEIKIKAGSNVVPVVFTQLNLAGDYSCAANNGATPQGFCVIEDTDNPVLYKIIPTGSAYDAPYYAKYRDEQLVIYFGQYLGQSAKNKDYTYVYLCAFDKVGYLIPNGDVEYVASIKDVATNGKMQFKFKDNGTWRGQKVDGFYYGLYNNLLEKGGKTTGDGIAAPINLVWTKK